MYELIACELEMKGFVYFNLLRKGFLSFLLLLELTLSKPLNEKSISEGSLLIPASKQNT